MSTVIQRRFSAGELTPSLWAGADLARYQTALRTCRNNTVLRHGGTQSRPGSLLVGEVNDSTKPVRLIPFVFNANQSHVLEVGNQYIRIITDGQYLLESPKTITGITQANPAVVTSAAHGYANGDEIVPSNIVGMTQLNGRHFKVAGVAANTFQLHYMDGTPVDATGFGAYVSGGISQRVYTINTGLVLNSPYATADLPYLRFVQSADVITITHQNYPPCQLKRLSPTSWTFSQLLFNPSILPPTGLSQSGLAGTLTAWVVTTISAATGEESYASASVTSGAFPTQTSPVDVTWTAVAGALSYNVYRAINGVWGFYANTTTNLFRDYGFGTPDTGNTAPFGTFSPFDNVVGDYPLAVTYYQQRQIFANTPLKTQKSWASRNGYFTNFNSRTPVQSDDPVVFTLEGAQVNPIQHMLALGKLIMFTSGGEISIEGDSAGVLRPGEVNSKPHTYNGSSFLRPLPINGVAIYVQARGSIVRDLAYVFQSDGYRGDELSVYAAHLIDGYTLVDWDYQKTPQSIVWMVRSDGTLLGMTYVREQQIVGWHRHDTDGVYENVCSVPEGSEDAVYVVVRRTINGATKRYVERWASRTMSATTSIKDYVGVDCGITVDGRNLSMISMTLSGGTNWDYTETLTLTASSLYFQSSDVGNEIQLTGPNGELIRFEIQAFTSTTVVTGIVSETVPVSMRSVALTSWAKAITHVTNLYHLEGKKVSVLGDGYVVASPNNANYPVLTVANGAVTLPRPYAVIHVGLPFVCDLETLDIDTAQGETLSDKEKLVGKVTLHIESSRSAWIGGMPPTNDAVDPLENLTEFKHLIPGYDSPYDLITGKIGVNMLSDWNYDGHVFVRHVDPLPLSVLAISAAGMFPFKAGA